MATVTGALDGTLVLDATASFWASLGTALLADFGAQVVRLEGLAGAPLDAASLTSSAHYELANRNKLSMRVDASRPEGRLRMSEIWR